MSTLRFNSLAQLNRVLLFSFCCFLITISLVYEGLFKSSILLFFLVLGTYLYCIKVNKERDGFLFVFVFFLIVIRVVFAFYDAQFSILPGMDKDPIRFYTESIFYLKEGVEFSFLNGSAAFKLFLGGVYQLLGENRFSGNVMSVVFSVFALILFYECLKLLNIKNKKTMMLIFGMHSSFFLHSVTTMREAYLTSFVLLFSWLSLSSLMRKKYTTVYFVLALFSLLLLPLFHVKAFYLYSVFAVLVFLSAFFLITYRNFSEHNKPLFLIMIVMVPLIFLYKGGDFVRIVKGESPYEVSGLLAEGDFGLEGLNNYLSSTQKLYSTHRQEARTQFRTTLDTSSIDGFLSTMPISFYYYMTAPMPWGYRGEIKDLLPMSESILRVVVVIFIVFFLLNFFLSRSNFTLHDRRYSYIVLYLFVLYLGQCGIWSLGTFNYGQSYRHHISATPILLLCLGVVISHLNPFKYLSRFKN